MRRPPPWVWLAVAGVIAAGTVGTDVYDLAVGHALPPIPLHELAVAAMIIAALAGLLGLLVEDLFRVVVRLRAERRRAARHQATGRQPLEETTDEIIARVVPFRRRGA